MAAVRYGSRYPGVQNALSKLSNSIIYWVSQRAGPFFHYEDNMSRRTAADRKYANGTTYRSNGKTIKRTSAKGTKRGVSTVLVLVVKSKQPK